MTKGELERIANEVTAQFLHQSSTPKAGSLLVILPQIPMGIDGCVDYISRHYDLSEATLVCYDKTLYNDIFYCTVDIGNASDAKCLCENLHLYGDVLLATSGIKLIERIASVDEDDVLSAVVLYKILHGADVTLLVDYDIENLKQGKFSKQIKDLHSTLSDMGVDIKRITTPEQEEFNPMSGLITEDIVEQMYSSGKRDIVVREGVIVTPLATDRAEELGIRIRQG